LKLPYCRAFFTLYTYGASAPVTDDFQIGPVPEGRGEPSGLTMIPITSFVGKSDRASRFFVLTKQKLTRRLIPALRDGGSLFVFKYRR